MKIHPLIQKLFVFLALSGFALQVAQITYWAISQFSYNSDLRGVIVWATPSVLAPIYFFLFAYFTFPRAAGRLQSFFRTLLLTTLGVMLHGIFVQILNFAYLYGVHTSNGYWEATVYQLLPTIVAVVVYPLAVIWVKRKNVLG